MAQINCEDCLRTYRPYSYSVAFMRVLMYGFSDWWKFEDVWVIEEQLREHLRNPNVKQWLIDKTRTYSKDDSFAGDFNFYYQYLENKRRQKHKRLQNISATFLCFDCEKYYCSSCVGKHSGHFTFSKDDKYNISKWGRISAEILGKLKAEGDQKRENLKREKPFLSDVVDVRCEHDKLDLHNVLWELERSDDGTRHSYGLKRYYGDDDYEFMIRALDCVDKPRMGDLHILHDNKKWLVTDDKNNCVKIFDVKDNKMTRYIKLSSSPHSITEIPSTDPSSCLIAVSFPWEEQITIMNIHSTPAQVVSSIDVQGRCYDLAYCNNKLITWCWDYLGGDWCYLIHVMKMPGEIINIIDLHNLPGFKLELPRLSKMSVHSESETIYVCHMRKPSCVISLSLDGQVLHSVTFTDLEPALIHVDKDQNVYVIKFWLPIHKLSADLRHREKIIDRRVINDPWIDIMRVHNDKFYLAPNEGPVYIIQHDSSLGQG